MVQDAGVGVGRHAYLVKYPARACVAGSLRGLEADRADFADFRGVVVGHAVKEGCAVSGAGCLHLVHPGVLIMGPCRTDGTSGYGGGPAPVCRPCLGDGARGWLEGGGGVCQVECLEAHGGVQDPCEVVRQALVGLGEGLGGQRRISWEMGQV